MFNEIASLALYRTRLSTKFAQRGRVGAQPETIFSHPIELFEIHVVCRISNA